MRTHSAPINHVPVPFILTRKNLTPYHIVVGDDPVQIRFLAQSLIPNSDLLENHGVQRVDRATDDLLVGRETALLHVYAAHRIDLSPEMRSKTTIWAADPIVKGSAAMNAIVKFAATGLPGLEKKLTRDEVELVGAQLARRRFNDLRAMLWEAASLIGGDLTPPKRWLDPWESTVTWMDSTMDPKERLNGLYRKLVAYTRVHDDPEEATRIGVTPEQFRSLKKLALDRLKVEKTITLLRCWRDGILDAFICYGLVDCVWESDDFEFPDFYQEHPMEFRLAELRKRLQDSRMS